MTAVYFELKTLIKMRLYQRHFSSKIFKPLQLIENSTNPYHIDAPVMNAIRSVNDYNFITFDHYAFITLDYPDCNTVDYYNFATFDYYNTNTPAV